MGLWRYIVIRFLQALVVLFFVSIATFGLMHATPGDPVNSIIGERQAERPEVRAAIESQYGLDKPIPVQYAYYVKNLLQGDMGTTITDRKDVRDELSKVVPATMELAFAAMFFAVIVGVPLGIIAAVKQGRWPDHLARFISLIGTSMPVFWLGLLLAYLVTYKW